MGSSTREPVTRPDGESRRRVAHDAATSREGNANAGDGSPSTDDTAALDSAGRATTASPPSSKRRKKFVDPNSLVALGES